MLGRVSKNRQTVAEAKTVLLKCPYCPASLEVWFGHGFTPEQKHEARKAAVDEHRRLCSGAPPEAQRVYTIHYPRA